MTQISGATSSRIEVIDALRGFALFGILYAHMIFWYSAGELPEFIYRDPTDIASGIAAMFYFIFILAKFFSIFSFLFGLSFYLQIRERADKLAGAGVEASPIPRFVWRLTILGVIGLIHHSLWRGDILTIYVPLGFLLILCRNLSNKAIVIIGAILILNIPTKIYEGIYLFLHNSKPFVNPNRIADTTHYFEIMSFATLSENIVDNLKALPVKLSYQLSSGRLIITFGFFLLGMLAGRMRWFENLDNAKPLVKIIWKKSGLALLLVIVAGVLFGTLNTVLDLKWQDNLWATWALSYLADLFNGGLTIFYISGLILLMFRERWKRFLSPLASVGKMALTSYLMQTVFGLFLFYGFGMELFHLTTMAINALLAILIFGLQILFSRWWLSHFYYGPVEWLWRSATYLKWQKMLRRGPTEWQRVHTL